VTRLLEHRRVLVTGGARGIGRAVAEAVLAHGGSVAILDVLDEGDAVAAELADGGATVVHADCGLSARFAA
jgi:NAD(P)-dependent dehydrogenase (short-subunit alcohol dehydrogenase family)